MASSLDMKAAITFAFVIVILRIGSCTPPLYGMGDLLFEDAETARNYQDYRPNYGGLGLEEKVTAFMGQTRKQSQNADTNALDVGCGSGQLTKVLAPLFTKVIGIDRSKAQIDVAKEVTTEKNIEYRVNLAEDLSFLQDGSVDLVSAAAAIYFFEPEPFLAEVDRVLKPGGCFLVLLLGADSFSLKALTSNEDVKKKCHDLQKDFVAASFRIFREGSKKVISSESYPTPEYPDTYHFQVTSKRQYDNINEFVGFLKSTGTLREYSQKFPEEGDQVEIFKNRLLSILAAISSAPERTPVVFSWLFNCYMYRKPI